jgi:type I restriction enzyme S subunit
MCTNQGCKTAVPPDFIDSRYLYWFLVNATPDLEARASGTTFKEISGKRFAETEFWWPPLVEQRRIVEVLEDHLSRLDAASANLRASDTRAEAWAQSSIDGIVWHQQDARTVAVADLLAEKMRNGHSARASATGRGVRALTLTAVTRGSFTDAFTKIVAVEPERVQDLWLRDGDVLVQRSNTPDLVGTTAIYHGPQDWAIFPDLLIRLRANASQVSPDYLAIVLKTERAHRLLRARAKGLAGSMPKIDQNAIGSLLVPVLDHRGQAKVVSRVTEIEEAKVQLIVEVQTAHRRAAGLRKALLGDAFSGRLAIGGRKLDHAEELAGV